MVSITLKNIPKQLHEQLKKQAKEHRRSLNSEILAQLEREEQEKKSTDRGFLERVRKMRESVGGYLTEKELKKYKNEGRP